MAPKAWRTQGSNPGPQGTNLSLTTYSNKVSISSKNLAWNDDLCHSRFLHRQHYPLHLNLQEHHTLDHFIRSAFPIRIIGGILTVTMIQLLIQTRLLTIMSQRLILNGLDEGELKRLDEVDPSFTPDQVSSRYVNLHHSGSCPQSKLPWHS